MSVLSVRVNIIVYYHFENQTALVLIDIIQQFTYNFPFAAIYGVIICSVVTLISE